MRNCPNYRCKQYDELGHSESRCPTIECFNCHRFGHKSFNCTEYEEDYEQETMEDQQDKVTVHKQPDLKVHTRKDRQVTDQATRSNLDTGESETSIVMDTESKDLPKQRHSENIYRNRPNQKINIIKGRKKTYYNIKFPTRENSILGNRKKTRMKRVASTDEVYTVPKKLTSRQKKITQPAIEKNYSFRP
ncbi:hypothetical protein BSL78_07036 [Apostichopus japonicus]|uniref:CCHC-type domain-containing protein n=1 Tax=Stichopus japonicus TaxID=307972 RepID=A0A2G8L716_STIJA|nr:hypothetical protein BSL78_07036 [Apostichopus japonicus]